MPVASTRPLLRDTARAAQWFHGLSDVTRLQIVEMLSHKERCVCELEQVLEIAQSRLSFHLKVLKDAGLIRDRRDGRWMFYNINPDVLDQMATFTRSVKPGKHAGSCSLACCD
jgi:ArsR family transcriptional regulator, arsenate/arsenite/antimonite-responsive transcriptional repressor